MFKKKSYNDLKFLGMSLKIASKYYDRDVPNRDLQRVKFSNRT